MSRFNVRPIGGAGAAPPAAPPIHDKKPSAYAAMKGSGSASVASMAIPEGPSGSKGSGRMTKDDLRRHKMDLADARIQVLVTMKPTRAKIREYIESRIMELDEQKR